MNTPEMPEVLKSKRDELSRYSTLVIRDFPNANWAPANAILNGFNQGFIACYAQLAPLLIEAKKTAEFYSELKNYTIFYPTNDQSSLSVSIRTDKARELLEKFKEMGL